MLSVLIAERRPSTRLALRHILARLGHRAHWAEDWAELSRQLGEGGFDAAVVSLELVPGGPEVPPPELGLPVVYLAHDERRRPGITPLRCPADLDRLGAALAGPAERPEESTPAVVLRPLEEEPAELRPHRSAAWSELERKIRALAPHALTVLIRGESGTGKELVARALHEEGPRADGPFVAVHCGAIPADLLESELFGHERGAFTDAHRTHRGHFEAAGDGSLLLDEVGEMPLAVQSKLLRVLEQRAFTRVGGERSIPFEARVLAATNRDLRQMVDEGSFREDLLHRLLVAELLLPPLRERPEDLELLCGLFLRRAAEGAGREIVGIDESGWEKLRHHHWPGNVRELEHLLQRSVMLASNPILSAEDLLLEESEGFGGYRDAAERELRRRIAAGESEATALGALEDELRRAAEKLGITKSP